MYVIRCSWERTQLVDCVKYNYYALAFMVCTMKTPIRKDPNTWTAKNTHANLTPSLPQPVNFPAEKVHTCTLPNSIFDGPITNLLSTLSISIQIFSRVHAKGAKKPECFFLIWHFYESFSEWRRGKHGSERVNVTTKHALKSIGKRLFLYVGPAKVRDVLLYLLAQYRERGKQRTSNPTECHRSPECPEKIRTVHW